MIVDEYVEITIIAKMIGKYRELGYENLKIGDKIKLKPHELNPNSKIKVDCKCFHCSDIKKISYMSYYHSINGTQIKDYYCKSCLYHKNKRSLALTYGENITNVSQLESTQKSIKETSKLKFGVEHFSQNEEIKEKKKQTNLERYGVDCVLQSEEVKDKIKETNNILYGFDNVSQNENIKQQKRETTFKTLGYENPFHSPIVKEKSKITNNIIYGCDYPTQSQVVKDKTKKTNFDRYGKEFVLQVETIRDKGKESLIKKYGFDNIFKTVDFSKNTYAKSINTSNLRIFNKYKEIYKDEYDFINFIKSEFTIKHLSCNVETKISTKQLIDRNSHNNPICLHCFPISENVSIGEKELADWISSFVEIERNDKNILKPKHLDIYISSNNLAIEFNGLRYHSENFREKDYHLNKSLKCQEKSIHLMHIWEDEWKLKQEIVKSIILNKLNEIENKIFARKCVIKEVTDTKLIRKFLDDNHIQGYSQSSIKLGLYYNDELVSLMTFGYRHTNRKKEFELIRFCNKINTNVIGASSKLFKYYLNNYSENNILSYSDFRLFDGKMYETLGFEKIHLSKPDYFWCKGLERKHRFNFNKQQLIKDGYDPNKTEVEIMHERGYSRIWGCGQIRWEYKR